MKPWKRVLAFLVAIFAGAGACGGETATTNGGETNWLGDCSATGVCADGECLCGLCTALCSIDDDCTRAGPASCATPDGVLFQATCGDEGDGSSGVCIARCEGDGACQEGLICSAGACLAPALVAEATPELRPGSAAFFSDVLAQRGVSSPADGGEAGLIGRCLPALAATSDGGAPCVVLEASPTECDCGKPGRAPASESFATLAASQLEAVGACDVPERPACEDLCVCEVTQETGSSSESCRNDPETSPDGWCYISPSQDLGDPSFIEACEPIEPQLLRLGPLAADGAVFIGCTPAPRMLAGRNATTATPGDLGDPCLPGDEYDVESSGFSPLEVYVERGFAGCTTGVCLVHNFQGKINCPYGNQDSSGDCATPDGRLVAAPVNPQLWARPPEDAVLCSCRCAGPDPDAEYCECPDGFECEPLIPDVGLGGGRSAGSYCIKTGTGASPGTFIPVRACSRENADCE